jgi:hypothetical protein
MPKQLTLANRREVWDAAGPRMRQAVRIVAVLQALGEHQTAYWLAGEVGRDGNPRSGYPVVRRCLAAGLLTTTAAPDAPITANGWISVPPEVAAIID